MHEMRKRESGREHPKGGVPFSWPSKRTTLDSEWVLRATSSGNRPKLGVNRCALACLKLSSKLVQVGVAVRRCVSFRQRCTTLKMYICGGCS